MEYPSKNNYRRLKKGGKCIMACQKKVSKKGIRKMRGKK